MSPVHRRIVTTLSYRKTGDARKRPRRRPADEKREGSVGKRETRRARVCAGAQGSMKALWGNEKALWGNEKSESVRRGEHGGSVGKREALWGTSTIQERECAAAANQPAARRLGVPLSGYSQKCGLSSPGVCNLEVEPRTLKASRSVAGWRCARVRACDPGSRGSEMIRDFTDAQGAPVARQTP